VECFVYGGRKPLPVLGMLITLQLLLALESLKIAEPFSSEECYNLHVGSLCL